MKEILEIFSSINKNTENFFENGFITFLISAICILFASYVLYHVLKHMIKKKQVTNTNLAMNVLKSVIIVLALYQVLTMIKPISGITNTILASGGIIALALSLSAQEVLSNLISGIMIALTHPFVEGDLVHINAKTYSGVVERITLRHTVIRTIENNRITIPNSMMNSAAIENNDLVESRKTNYLFLEISYDSSIDKAMEIIKNEAGKHPLCLDCRNNDEEEIVKVLVTDFLSSSVQLRAAINSKTAAEGLQMLSDLRISIKRRFEEEGIEIPYNYTNIIVKHEEKA